MTVHAALLDPGHKWRDADDGAYVDALSMLVGRLNLAISCGAQVRFESDSAERPIYPVTLHQLVQGDRQYFLMVIDRSQPARAAKDAVEVALAFMREPDEFLSCSEERWSDWEVEDGEACREVGIWSHEKGKSVATAAEAEPFLQY